MKKERKSFKVSARIAFGILLLLSLLAVFTNSLILLSSNLNAPTTAFPSNYTLGLLYDFSYNAENGSKMLTQVFGNLFSYILVIFGLVVFVLSLCLIKYDGKTKAKCAFLGLGLVIPALFGFVSGSLDFLMRGFTVLKYFSDLESGLIMGGVVSTLILDFLYFILVLVCFIKALRMGNKIKQGVPYEEPVAPVEEKKEEEPAPVDNTLLLEDIRSIVKEELNKLDRIVIAREVKVAPRPESKPAPQPAPQVEQKPEPKPEPKPAPVEEKKEEPKPVPAPAPAPAETEEESKGSIQRVPFTDKIINADRELQQKYNELKSEILAYGASSRVSVACDTFRLHRKAFVKITILGKMLKVYFALDPKEFADSTIPIYDVSNKVAYSDTPALLKVKSGLSVKRCKELIDLVFSRDGISKEKEPEQHDWAKEIKFAQKDED